MTTSTLTVTVPKGVKIADVALAAGRALTIGDRTVIGGAVSNTGTAGSSLGIGTRSGAVTSAASIDLRANSRVTANAITAGTVIRSSGAAVDGQIIERATLTPLVTQTFDATFPATTCQSIMVAPDTSVTAVPGRYCRIQLKARGTLSLRSGDYFVDILDPIETDSHLFIDDRGGPVRIFVTNPFVFRATVAGTSSIPDLMFGVVGAGTVSIESAFIGTIIAPNAIVSLSASGKVIVGSFFGLDVVVQPDINLQQRSASPLRPCDDGNSCTKRDILEAGICVGHDPIVFGVPESDPAAPHCTDGSVRIGCRGFDCTTGLVTGTWLAPPICGTPPACTAACPATGCTPQNNRNGSVVECSCSCADPAGGSAFTLPVQVCDAAATPSCSAICANAVGVCDGDVSCRAGTCVASAGAVPRTVLSKSCRLGDVGTPSGASPFSATIDSAVSRVEVKVGGRVVTGVISGSLGFSTRDDANGSTFSLSSLNARIAGPIDLFGRRIDSLDVSARHPLFAPLGEGTLTEPFVITVQPNDLAARVVVAGVPRFLSLDATSSFPGSLSVDRRVVTFGAALQRPNGDRIAMTITARTTNFPPLVSIAVTPGTVVECTGGRSAQVTLRATASDPNPGNSIARFQWTRRDPQAIDRQLGVLGSGALITPSLPLGPSEIAVVAYDNRLAAGRALVSITVRDTIAPTVAAPPDKTVNAGAGMTSAVVDLGSPQVSDTCDARPTVRVLLGSTVLTPSYAVLPVGTSTVTWRVTDAGGNIALASQRVTVLAEAPASPQPPPVVEAPGVCAAPFSPPGAPEIPVDVQVCFVGRINQGSREGAGPWETCADDTCTQQKIQALVASANPFYTGFVRFNFVGAKRLQDPNPPGSELCNTASYGDVCIIPGFGPRDAGPEGNQMVRECFAIWGEPPGAFDTCRRALKLVLVRGSATNGICGVGAAARSANPTTNCLDPTTLPDNTSGAFALMATVTGFGLVACDQSSTVAHELGHALGLEHGDGLDNNCNGIWDENCDRSSGVVRATDEVDDGPATLMFPNGPNAPLTALQKDRARIYGSKSVPTFGTAGANCTAPGAPIPPVDSTATTPPPAAGCGCATTGPGAECGGIALTVMGVLLLLMRTRMRTGRGNARRL